MDDDDDDDEQRPKRWRMRPPDDEDEEDSTDDEELEFARLPRSVLRAIASDQKAILVCILFQMTLAAANFFVPPESRLFVLIGFLAVGIASTILVFLLATKVYGTAAGIVLGILTLIPCIGLIVLLLINGKATSILKRHDVHVGLLGARMSDI